MTTERKQTVKETIQQVEYYLSGDEIPILQIVHTEGMPQPKELFG